MSLIAVLLGVVGAILSVFKSRWCFMVWIFPNTYWVWFNWPGYQSWVFIVMQASCVAGWIAWDLDSIERRKLSEENVYFRQGWTQAQDTIIKLKDFTQGFADEPCFYGDNCPEFIKLNHGECDNCRARRALKGGD